jgi:ketosteroid isomerase-like protein
MPDADLERVMQADHRALDAFVQGDPEPKKRLYSRRDDITLANPLGPPARGWAQIEATMNRASSLLRDGEPNQFERVSAYATADLAYIVEFERTRVRIGGDTELTPLSLRVTTVFRREEDGWKVVHRHADTVTTPQGADVLRGAPIKR